VGNVFTKDYGLSESVRGLQIFRDLLSYQFVSFFEYEFLIVIALIVDAIWNLFSILVSLAFFRTPAGQVFIEVDSDDFVWRQETILDSLLERVSKHGSGEVFDVRDVPCFLWCSCHTNLRCA